MVCVQWYTDDTTLYSQPLAQSDADFLDSDSDYDEFDPKPLAEIPPGKFITSESEFYQGLRNVRSRLLRTDVRPYAACRSAVASAVAGSSHCQMNCVCVRLC